MCNPVPSEASPIPLAFIFSASILSLRRAGELRTVGPHLSCIMLAEHLDTWVRCAFSAWIDICLIPQRSKRRNDLLLQHRAYRLALVHIRTVRQTCTHQWLGFPSMSRYASGRHQTSGRTEMVLPPAHRGLLSGSLMLRAVKPRKFNLGCSGTWTPSSSGRSHASKLHLLPPDPSKSSRNSLR